MIRLPPRFTRTDPLYPSTTPCRSADGYLYLADRVSNMIISGGVNIYPREVEDVLIGHPLVDDVAVIGVPDEEMGEAVRAVRSEEHTSELQSLMRISYAVVCLQKKQQ